MKLKTKKETLKGGGGTYLTVQRNILEDLNVQERRCDKLKSRIINLILITLLLRRNLFS